MGHEDVPVLIVGGSLVGLSTAVFLGHHGVPSLVLERHRGTAIHPRAALVNQRTMETYRAVGLEEQINQIVGVVTVGLFARRPADVLIVARDSGVETFKRK